MKIIVGLGNPGKHFQNTRHNIGFLIIEKFRKINKLAEFKLAKKFNSLISENVFEGEKLILAKPQTFMNRSGQAVKKLVGFYKIPSFNLAVVHDDIDLPIGKVKIAINRGSGGHKGVDSIIKEVGTKNFIRFRIGICPKGGKPQNTEKFVLQSFNKEEKEAVRKIIAETAEAIKALITEGPEKTVSKYNK